MSLLAIQRESAITIKRIGKERTITSLPGYKFCSRKRIVSKQSDLQKSLMKKGSGCDRIIIFIRKKQDSKLGRMELQMIT